MQLAKMQEVVYLQGLLKFGQLSRWFCKKKLLRARPFFGFLRADLARDAREIPLYLRRAQGGASGREKNTPRHRRIFGVAFFAGSDCATSARLLLSFCPQKKGWVFAARTILRKINIEHAAPFFHRRLSPLPAKKDTPRCAFGAACFFLVRADPNQREESKRKEKDRLFLRLPSSIGSLSPLPAKKGHSPSARAL